MAHRLVAQRGRVRDAPVGSGRGLDQHGVADGLAETLCCGWCLPVRGPGRRVVEARADPHELLHQERSGDSGCQGQRLGVVDLAEALDRRVLQGGLPGVGECSSV